MDRECTTAVKEDREMHDRFNKPYTGPDKSVDSHASGRTKLGKEPWINWTKAELDLRDQAKAAAIKIRDPILAQIRTKHPNLRPDPM